MISASSVTKKSFDKTSTFLEIEQVNKRGEIEILKINGEHGETNPSKKNECIKKGDWIILGNPQVMQTILRRIRDDATILVWRIR